MMYPFVKYADGTEAVFSSIYKDDQERECVDIHFERPTKNGFDSLRIKLPTYEITVWEGNYTDKEIAIFKSIVERGAPYFYEWAHDGGIHIDE